MYKYLLCIALCVVLMPGKGMCGSEQVETEIPLNTEIVAGESARMILELLDPEGRLQTPDGFIAQPVFLRMDAPASVREHIISQLLLEGVRITADPAGYQTLRIEWESENSLVQESGNRNLRKMQSTVIFSWLDEDQEIQKTWKDTFVREDLLPSDQVAAVSSNWNPAAFHRQEATRRFSVIRRIAEPALITGAVAVTIYLLYNVRR